MIKKSGKTYSRTVNSLFISHTSLNRFLQVSEAIILANDLLQNPEFYDRVATHPGFDLADVSPEIIAGLMCETHIKMSVHLYYATNAHLPIDGFDDISNPSCIHLNVWNINRSAASICNTIIHSCVHAVNAYNSQLDFGHGGNAAGGKDNTAPFWIGALAQRMVSDDEAVITPFRHDPDLPVKKVQIPDVDSLVGFSQSMWLTC